MIRPCEIGIGEIGFREIRGTDKLALVSDAPLKFAPIRLQLIHWLVVIRRSKSLGENAKAFFATIAGRKK